MQIPRSWKTLI